MVQTHGYVLVSGLSTDTKPTTGINEGTQFIETDTHKRYTFSFESGSLRWVEQNAGSDNSVDKTHAELSTMIAESSLVVGQMYKITDYRTIYEQANTGIISESVAGITNGLQATDEPILVKAVDTDKLDPVALSSIHKNEFMYYSHESETLGGSVSTKGKITYRCDVVKNVAANFDFRAVKFRLFMPILDTFSSGETYTENAIYVNSDIEIYNGVAGVPISPNDYCLTSTINGTSILPIDNSDYEEVYCFNHVGYTPTDLLENFTNISIVGENNVITSKTNDTCKGITIVGNNNSIVVSGHDSITLNNVSNSLVYYSSDVLIEDLSELICSTCENLKINISDIQETKTAVTLVRCKNTIIESIRDSFLVGTEKCKIGSISGTKLYNTVVDSTILQLSETRSYANISKCHFELVASCAFHNSVVISDCVFYRVNAVNITSNNMFLCLLENVRSCSIGGTHSNTKFGLLLGVNIVNLNTQNVVIPSMYVYDRPSSTITATGGTIETQANGRILHTTILESGATETKFLS